MSVETIKLAPRNPKPEGTTWGDYRPGLALSAVLFAARSRGDARVMLTGPAPAREWFTAPVEGWRAVRLFPDHDIPAGRYTADDGHTVEVRRAAEWFGGGDYTRADAANAWTELHRGLAASGRGGAAMFRSPSATGLDLWLRASGAVVPAPLDEDTQELIRATAPQHRIEMFEAPRGGATMPALWVMDGRLMYAALTRELGSGPVRRMVGREAEELSQANPYRRARYLVRWQAPADWWTLGLLMAKDSTGGWHAPLAGEAWVDAAELHLARTYEWKIEVKEGFAFTGGRPLDTWTDRLIRTRDRSDNPLVKGGARAVLLQSIGAWHSRGRDEMSLTASPMVRPDGDGWDTPERLDDGQAVWRRRAPEPSARQAALRHPEYSAQVWGRSHARLMESPTSDPKIASGAIHTRVGTLVSLYGDAIITTELPRWASMDDGKVGRLRIKGHLCGPLDWPTTARERDALVRAAETNGTDCTRGCA